jgi:hypothetical protein
MSTRAEERKFQRDLKNFILYITGARGVTVMVKRRGRQIYGLTLPESVKIMYKRGYRKAPSYADLCKRLGRRRSSALIRAAQDLGFACYQPAYSGVRQGVRGDDRDPG